MVDFICKYSYSVTVPAVFIKHLLKGLFMSSSSSSASASAGVPVFGLAFAVLFVLKVAGSAGASWGLASLSWWIVFSPLLIGFGIFLFWLLVVVIIALLASK